MIKRVRDKLRNYRPQEVISYEDWSDIESRFSFASDFMRDDNPAYTILKSDLEQAREIVLHNRVHEVKEIRIIGELQKVFTTDKKEQMDELVGQIKYIEGYLGELQSWISRKVDLERLEGDGKIIIRRRSEDQILDERPTT